MLRSTVFPMRNFHIKPVFLGVDRDLKDVVDSLENVWEGIGATSSTTDFRETDQAYFMSIDMPGVSKSNIELHVDGEQILINGTRKRALIEGENNTQKISRTVVMPEQVDREKIQAHCEDGVLYLALPKVEKAKPKKIEIGEGFKNTAWNNLLSEKKETEKKETVA
jgi:HSP20 family protein